MALFTYSGGAAASHTLAVRGISAVWIATQGLAETATGRLDFKIGGSTWKAIGIPTIAFNGFMFKSNELENVDTLVYTPDSAQTATIIAWS